MNRKNNLKNKHKEINRLIQAYEDLKSGNIIEFLPDNKRIKGGKCWMIEVPTLIFPDYMLEEVEDCYKDKIIYWDYFGIISSCKMSLMNLEKIANFLGCYSYEYKKVI